MAGTDPVNVDAMLARFAEHCPRADTETAVLLLSPGGEPATGAEGSANDARQAFRSANMRPASAVTGSPAGSGSGVMRGRRR